MSALPDPVLPTALWTLALSPAGRLHLEPAAAPEDGVAGEVAQRIHAAFERGPGHGILHLGASELTQHLPAALAWFRDLGRALMTRLCGLPDLEEQRDQVELPLAQSEAMALAATVPPMSGAEYLSAEVLEALWTQAVEAFRAEVRATKGTVQDWLKARNPLWNLVGRVHFHLAERKDDARAPFAFLATYTTRVGAEARVQHRPLGQAVQASASARDKKALLALLKPVQRAAERSAFLKALLDSGQVFHPVAWTPADAYRFLKDLPEYEAAGVVVRIPDWWKARRAPRPTVQVAVGTSAPSELGLDALLDFQVSVSLGDTALSTEEWQAIQRGADGLVRLRGQWIEVDRKQLTEALEHWQYVQQQAAHGGVSFIEGMRLLAGAPIEAEKAAQAPVAAREWSTVAAGDWLRTTLQGLRAEGGLGALRSGRLRATLRPYQETGATWLRFLTRLGLGACLADDMGLGKTIQVLALLLELRREPGHRPSLLVLPASLVGNWQAELARFAPSLLVFVAHASAQSGEALARVTATDLAHVDLVITTYGTALRLPWLAETPWQLVILDEAQAIKNPGARQTRVVKAFKAQARIALTGTPIENRLGDLWSLFDFLNPGLLGGSGQFTKFVRRLRDATPPDFGPLRRLVQPYILRRLKTDRRIIADLPDKTEVKALCSLTPAQAALYQQSVKALAGQLTTLEGIQRRGVVLAFLMRFKQICNHPSQWLGDGGFDPAASGKYARLSEIAEAIASRQEKALVFTQFREMTEPLHRHLTRVFGRPGLLLHGGTPVKDRSQLVERFQGDDAVPFLVLSVKAGGTGLNLTAASHVVHFDRWWNPAVEDQATDRAFRIGQKRNVLVHKFVCRGTVEERIDQMIEDKRSVARDVLADGGETLLTEMSDKELLDFVALDVGRAAEQL